MGTMRAKMPWDEEPKKKIKLLSNGDRVILLMSLALFLYSASAGDVPLGFFTAAFMMYIGHVVLERMQQGKPSFLSNMLKGLSWAMFAGSFVMVVV